MASAAVAGMSLAEVKSVPGLTDPDPRTEAALAALPLSELRSLTTRALRSLADNAHQFRAMGPELVRLNQRAKALRYATGGANDSRLPAAGTPGRQANEEAKRIQYATDASYHTWQTHLAKLNWVQGQLRALRMVSLSQSLGAAQALPLIPIAVCLGIVALWGGVWLLMRELGDYQRSLNEAERLGQTRQVVDAATGTTSGGSGFGPGSGGGGSSGGGSGGSSGAGMTPEQAAGIIHGINEGAEYPEHGGLPGAGAGSLLGLGPLQLLALAGAAAIVLPSFMQAVRPANQ